VGAGALSSEPPLSADVSDSFRKRPVVARRDEVDSSPHQRALNDRRLLERTRQVVAFEAFEPGPQPDVHRRCVLRLQTGHALEHSGQGRFASLQQLLAPEDRPVQGTRG